MVNSSAHCMRRSILPLMGAMRETGRYMAVWTYFEGTDLEYLTETKVHDDCNQRNHLEHSLWTITAYCACHEGTGTEHSRTGAGSTFASISIALYQSIWRRTAIPMTTSLNLILTHTYLLWLIAYLFALTRVERISAEMMRPEPQHKAKTLA